MKFDNMLIRFNNGKCPVCNYKLDGDDYMDCSYRVKKYCYNCEMVIIMSRRTKLEFIPYRND